MDLKNREKKKIILFFDTPIEYQRTTFRKRQTN